MSGHLMELCTCSDGRGGSLYEELRLVKHPTCVHRRKLRKRAALGSSHLWSVSKDFGKTARPVTPLIKTCALCFQDRPRSLQDLVQLARKRKMLGYATVTVLVPIQLQGRQSGYLCGNYTSTPCCTNGERASHVVVVTFADLQRSSCVGCINNKKRSQTRGARKNLWVELQTKPYLMLRSVRILEKNVSRSELNLVLYDAQEICESEIVCKKFLFEKDKDHANDIVPYFVHCVQEAYQQRATSKLKDSCIRLIRLMIKLFLILLWIPKFILENLHSVLVMRFDYSSSALQQLLLRISQLEKLHQELQVKKRTLLSGRLLTMIIVDILIGIAGASIISNYASVNDIYTYFCSWTKMLASIVHRLLEWLSGVPAGLKLNQPLTQALSAFFSYHVHLWRLYLELADPLLRGLAWVLVWLGMCGASVQVAILSDLFDLATLHLYCFYVYGARIHMLQISLLGSQWRAFRGRKWNPLKQRVDSYDVGGHVSLTRVLTAVVFTLVIFLLPTTTIYYMVFVLLRVGLNLMRGMMAFTIWLLNINPLYLFLLNITNSNRIKGDIFFSTVGGEEVGKECKETVTAPLVVQLHTWPTALSEVLLHAHAQIFPHRPSPNWKFIFSSIMFGEDLL